MILRTHLVDVHNKTRDRHTDADTDTDTNTTAQIMITNSSLLLPCLMHACVCKERQQKLDSSDTRTDYTS